MTKADSCFRKFAACVFTAGLCAFIFAEKLTFYDDELKQNSEYSECMKRYLADNDPEDCADYLLKTKDFYSQEKYDFSYPDTCAYEVTEAVLFRNYYSKKIGNREIVRAVEAYSSNFLSKFMPVLNRIVKKDGTRSLKNMKYVSLSKVYGLQIKYKEGFATREDFCSLLSKPEVLYAVFNNEKIRNSTLVKDLFINWNEYYSIEKPIGLSSSELQAMRNHSNYIIFPDKVLEVYSSLSEENIDADTMNVYRFSSLLKKVVDISIHKKIPIERYFLREELEVINDVLEDSFNVFSLNRQCVSYFAGRFNSIIMIEG